MGQTGGWRTLIVVSRGLTAAALTVFLASAGGAKRAQAAADGGEALQMLIDRREIIVPAKAAEIGRIGVSDVHGGVVTRQLRGGQRVAAVEGDVDLDGVEGDMDLRNLGGGRVDARVVDGTIRAEDLRSGFVRLVTTTGQIVLLGVL